MSVLLALAACGGGQPPITEVYTSSQTITIPAGVTNLVLLSGEGADGTPESSTYIRRYREVETVYNERNDAGGTITESSTTRTRSGSKPADYCTDKMPVPHSSGVINYTWTCYDYTNTSYTSTTPATTGANTTMTGPNGFSQTFSGGVGEPAVPRSVENIAVVAGGQYVLNIPSGGSISISYY